MISNNEVQINSKRREFCFAFLTTTIGIEIQLYLSCYLYAIRIRYTRYMFPHTKPAIHASDNIRFAPLKLPPHADNQHVSLGELTMTIVRNQQTWCNTSIDTLFCDERTFVTDKMFVRCLNLFVSFKFIIHSNMLHCICTLHIGGDISFKLLICAM